MISAYHGHDRFGLMVLLAASGWRWLLSRGGSIHGTVTVRGEFRKIFYPVSRRLWAGFEGFVGRDDERAEAGNSAYSASCEEESKADFDKK